MLSLSSDWRFGVYSVPLGLMDVPLTQTVGPPLNHLSPLTTPDHTAHQVPPRPHRFQPSKQIRMLTVITGQGRTRHPEFGCALLYLLSLSSDCSGRLEHALCLCGSSILQAVGSPLNINHPSPRSSRVSWAPTGEAYPHSISILLRRTPARYLVRTDQ